MWSSEAEYITYIIYSQKKDFLIVYYLRQRQMAQIIVNDLHKVCILFYITIYYLINRFCETA
jgi:hypothetical protein